MPPSSYPKTFDLPPVAGRGIRAPSVTVTKALQNPLLSSIMQDQHDSDWELIPTSNGPSTETASSKTTTNTNNIVPPVVDTAVANNANNADSRTQSGLSKPNIQALHALGSGLASQGHKTTYATAISDICANVDEMSVSNVDTSYRMSENKFPYSPANTTQADFEVSCMAPWADVKIKELNKK
ncbi:hypothetical protein V8C37DRAFT_209655 [Trichoderma ceciliae]